MYGHVMYSVRTQSWQQLWLLTWTIFFSVLCLSFFSPEHYLAFFLKGLITALLLSQYFFDNNFTIFLTIFCNIFVQYLLTIFLLKTSHHSFVPAQCGSCKSNITIALKIVQNLFITRLCITVQNSDWRCKVWEYELSLLDDHWSF